MEDKELADLRKQCITSLYLCTDNVSKYLDEEKEAEFDKLKSYVQEYCSLEARQEVAIQVLEKRIRNEMEAGNIDLLEQTFQTSLINMAEQQPNVANHPYMQEFKNRVKKGKEQSRNNLNESDLVVTESNEQFIDPITKTRIEDPVKNSICGHIYEKDSIMELIQMKKKTLCPVAGCGNRNPITRDHLQCDEELRFRMTLTQHSTMIQEHSILDLNDQSFIS